LVRLNVRDGTLISITPPDFQPHRFIGTAVSGEDAHGLVAGQITATTDHLLALGERTTHQPDPGADALGIGRQPFETAVDALSRWVISTAMEERLVWRKANGSIARKVPRPELIQIRSGETLSLQTYKSGTPSSLRSRNIAASPQSRYGGMGFPSSLRKMPGS